MKYVQTSNGTFVRHINNEFEVIRWNETNKTSVRALSAAKRIEFGLSRLQLVTPPSFDPVTQTRTNGEAVLVSGVWTQNWVVQEKYSDPVDKSNAIAAKEAEDAASVRSARDALLVATDWVVLRAKELGQTVPLDYYNYRGDLRQIPEQAGFPHNVTWPEEV